MLSVHVYVCCAFTPTLLLLLLFLCYITAFTAGMHESAKGADRDRQKNFLLFIIFLSREYPLFHFVSVIRGLSRSVVSESNIALRVTLRCFLLFYAFTNVKKKVMEFLIETGEKCQSVTLTESSPPDILLLLLFYHTDPPPSYS